MERSWGIRKERILERKRREWTETWINGEKVGKDGEEDAKLRKLGEWTSW